MSNLYFIVTVLIQHIAAIPNKRFNLILSAANTRSVGHYFIYFIRLNQTAYEIKKNMNAMA